MTARTRLLIESCRLPITLSGDFRRSQEPRVEHETRGGGGFHVDAKSYFILFADESNDRVESARFSRAVGNRQNAFSGKGIGEFFRPSQKGAADVQNMAISHLINAAMTLHDEPSPVRCFVLHGRVQRIAEGVV